MYVAPKATMHICIYIYIKPLTLSGSPGLGRATLVALPPGPTNRGRAPCSAAKWGKDRLKVKWEALSAPCHPSGISVGIAYATLVAAQAPSSRS